MILSLVLSLALLTAPTPTRAVVIDTYQNIVTVNIGGDTYAFRGTGYNTGEQIIVIMDNNEIKGVL